MKPLFILGITPRCGSNYLANLLHRHKEIARCGIVGEDFLTYHLSKLTHFSEGVAGSWSEVWKWNEKITPQSQKQRLNEALRDGLYRYLSDAVTEEGKYYATHTPYTHNLPLFKSFFSDAQLIVLVRSGLDAVESGYIGDFWSYRKGIKLWSESARRIVQEQQHQSFLLLKYEDLVKNPEKELTKAFEFLDLNPANYDYEALEQLPVYGSSTTKQKDGSFKWQRSTKSKDFNPLNRGANWPPHLRYYLEKNGGAAMRALGYDFPKKNYSSSQKLAAQKLDMNHKIAQVPVLSRVLKTKG